MGTHIDLVAWYTSANRTPVTNMGIIVATEKCTSANRTALTATPDIQPVPCGKPSEQETPEEYFLYEGHPHAEGKGSQQYECPISRESGGQLLRHQYVEPES